MIKVVFACVHNAGRSKMAAAWFNQLANPNKAYAVSAGTQPGIRDEIRARMEQLLAAHGWAS